jgi:hypothetical protein
VGTASVQDLMELLAKTPVSDGSYLPEELARALIKRAAARGKDRDAWRMTPETLVSTKAWAYGKLAGATPLELSEDAVRPKNGGVVQSMLARHYRALLLEQDWAATHMAAGLVELTHRLNSANTLTTPGALEGIRDLLSISLGAHFRLREAAVELVASVNANTPTGGYWQPPRDPLEPPAQVPRDRVSLMDRKVQKLQNKLEKLARRSGPRQPPPSRPRGGGGGGSSGGNGGRGSLRGGHSGYGGGGGHGGGYSGPGKPRRFFARDRAPNGDEQ